MTTSNAYDWQKKNQFKEDIKEFEAEYLLNCLCATIRIIYSEF